MVWKDNADSESGNVTFLKRSLFPKQHIYHYPREYGVYTQCLYKNRPCDIFNIHLDDQSPQKRYKQWDDLHGISRKEGCGSIIAGDFNHQYRKKCPLYSAPGFETHNLCPTYYIERKMNIDNIRRIANSVFFLEYFNLCEGENYAAFFGKPIAMLTYLQVQVLSYGRIFKIIHSNLLKLAKLISDIAMSLIR